MIKLLYVVFAGLVLFCGGAFAEGVKVEDSQGEYMVKIVRAQNVSGVEIRLSTDIVIDDCNTRTLDLTSALVAGDGDGWYDTYFLDAYVAQTKMFCPLESPVKETIYSRPVFIKSFSNENVHGEVRVSMVIPKGYKLEAVVINPPGISETEKAVKPEAAEAKDMIETEEYEVYTSVFASGKLDGIPYDYVVLEKETIKEKANKDNWKDIDGFMIDDFNSRNKMTYDLSDKFPKDTSPDGHGRLHIEVREQKDERYGPFDTGRTYVSRVGFSRDKTEAMVYVQHVATPESGIGHFVFLQKDNGKWTISGSIVGKIF